jgi:hypothetical protein
MSAPPRPCVAIARDHWHYHVPVEDDSIEAIDIQGVEYLRTLWQDPYGLPIFVAEGHDLLIHPPGSRPAVSDEQIEEHWRRVDSGELTPREFGEAMAALNVDMLRVRRLGGNVNPMNASRQSVWI